MKLNKLFTKVITMMMLLPSLASINVQAEDNVKDTTTKKVPQISVQLWSVKDAINHDFKGTLKALAAMGFAGIEFGPYAMNS